MPLFRMTRFAVGALVATLVAALAGCQPRSVYNVPPAHTTFMQTPGSVQLRGTMGVNGAGGELAWAFDSSWFATAQAHWIGMRSSDSNYLSSTYYDLGVAWQTRIRRRVFVSLGIGGGLGRTRCPPGLGGGLGDNGFGVAGWGPDSGAYGRIALQAATMLCWGSAITPSADDAETTGRRPSLDGAGVSVRLVHVEAFDLWEDGSPIAARSVFSIEPSLHLVTGNDRFGFYGELGTALTSTKLLEFHGFITLGFRALF